LLAKIQQQGTAMKEANIFEAWAERLIEGTWQTPDTPEKQNQLLELMSVELPVGADATNVTEQLYDLLGDDQLFDQLQELADRDPNADCRQIILDRMQELSSDPDVRQVVEKLNIDPTAEMNPPAGTPADLSDTSPEIDDTVPGASGKFNRLAEDSLNTIRRSAGLIESRMLDEDGSKLEHILNRFKHEVKQFEQNGELDQDLYEALFDYYSDAGEIPYGVAKARTGDPYEWVATNLQSHLSGGGIVGGNPDEDHGLERESIEHGDYAEERHSVDGGMENPLIQDEGIVGTALGGVAGGVLGGPVGAAVGSAVGDKLGDVISPDETNEDNASLFDDATCNMTESGENCPVHGIEECYGSNDSPLKGQYGHSGKMKVVDKDVSFLDRLKELSGMIRN
jgi:hypothetical protein